jgi:hypothetical protein
MDRCVTCYKNIYDSGSEISSELLDTPNTLNVFSTFLNCHNIIESTGSSVN